MYFKQGVITEERFRKMTPLQWVYHYSEIMRYRTTELKRENASLDLLLDRIETQWIVTNPDIGVKLLKQLKEAKIKAEDASAENDNITDQNFTEKWEELMKHMPSTIELPKYIADARKFVMPTQSRDNFVKGIELS